MAGPRGEGITIPTAMPFARNPPCLSAPPTLPLPSPSCFPQTPSQAPSYKIHKVLPKKTIGLLWYCFPWVRISKKEHDTALRRNVSRRSDPQEPRWRAPRTRTRTRNTNYKFWGAMQVVIYVIVWFCDFIIITNSAQIFLKNSFRIRSFPKNNPIFSNIRNPHHPPPHRHSWF